MGKKSPLHTAQIEMSGQGLRSRVAAADAAAAGPRARPKPKPKVRSQQPVLQVQPKHAAARQRQIDAATAADRAAILARKKKKGLRQLP